MAVSASTNGFRADAMNSAYLAGKSRYGAGSFLFFDAQASTDPLDNSSARGLFVDSSNRLSYWNGTTTVRLTGGGSGTTPTWEEIYAVDATFALTTATWTITQSAAADLLTLTKSNVGAGSVLAINNSGSGADVYGTSGTWQISAAGLAQFATNSIIGGALKVGSGSANGTVQSNGNYDLILKTGNATTMTMTFVDGANGDVDLALNGTGKLDISGTTTHNDALKVGAGDVTITLGDFSITDDENAESFSLTNNTATTIGNASSTGVVNIVSTSLTTGALVNLELTEGTLNGGWYLRCWDATAGAANFSVGEDGAVTILGNASGGSTVLTITKGDASMADGSLTIVDADNAATLSLTNDTATTASVVVVAGSGVFTGSTTTSFMTITPSGLTTGTAVYLPVAGLTTGKALDIAATVQTTGSLVNVSSTSPNALTTGELLTLTHTSGNITGTLNKTGNLASVTGTRTVTTGTVADDYDLLLLARADTINGAGAFTKTGSVLKITNATTNTSGTITDTTHGLEIVMDADGTGNAINITYPQATTGVAISIAASSATSTGTITVTNNALTTGTGLLVTSSGTIITTGELVSLVGNSATTCTGLLRISGTGLTDGWAIEATGGGANMTSSGGVVNVAMGAATDGSGVKIVSSGVYTGTVGLLAVTGNSATTGSIVTVTANGLTTGTALTLTSSGTIVTTGEMISVVANSATTCTGLIRASGTALTDGFVAEFTGGGANATATGGVLNLAAGAATDGSALKITTSGVYTGTVGVVDINAASATTGTVVDIGAAGITSGNALKISCTEATLTTGKYINCYDGAASDFTVGRYGATTIAGSALGTAALTLTAGDILLTSGNLKITDGAIMATKQALSGAGAVDVTHLLTEVTTTGADALTLANGTAGQIKIITMIVDGGEGTLTPDTPSGFATIKFNDVGDSVILVYTSVPGWQVLANNGCTIA